MPPAVSPTDPPAGFCFVTGCPRSGTSALTRLLNAHHGVVIGEERYRFLVRDLEAAGRLDEFGPQLFEPERFLDVREAESGYPRERFARLYDVAEHRLARQRMVWIGDKLIPPSNALVDAWADRFPGVRVVFIHRDPVAVAGSFQRRADDPDDRWPSRLGYRRMPRLWHRSLDALDHARARLGDGRVHVVTYEALFSESTQALEALAAFLDLDAAGMERRWAMFCAMADHQRPSGLTPRQEHWVRRRTDRPVPGSPTA